MANNHDTHLLQNYPSHKPPRSVLSRKIDGMVIAVREGFRVAWGEDPRNQQQRSFIDEAFCMRWLRNIADADQNVIKGTLCRSCGKVPAEAVTCPSNEDGAHRLEYSATARIDEVDAEQRVARIN